MTPEQIKNIAHLARLALTAQEINGLAKDLDKIFHLIDTMNELDTTEVKPMAHPMDAKQRCRPDEVTETNQRDRLLALAPQIEQGLFIVPEVIED